MEILGAKALVTGAASGIGRAIALALAAEGARLILTDINEQGLQETCGMIEGRGSTVLISRAFDIGDYWQVRRFAEDIHTGSGALDILVNVAGVALFSQIETMDHDDWERVIRVNLWGPVHGLECFVPEMIAKNKPGHIVSISSTAGLVGLPWHVVYSGTKHALVGISETLKYDLKKHGIGVTVVCPGAVKTGLVQTARLNTSAGAGKALRKRFMKVAIAPEKVAAQTINAIRKNTFLVITSPDITLLYLLKRYIPPFYHLFMQRLTRYMDKSLLQP